MNGVRPSSLAAVGAIAFAFALSPAAAAEPGPPRATKPTPAPAVSPASPPSIGHSSAVVQVAREIAQGLGAIPAGALVAVSSLTSDLPAPKGDELAVRLATHIAGQLGLAEAHPQATTLAVARGLSGRAASLVYVQLEIAKGELRATADLYPVVSNGWDRLRNPAPGPRAHAFTAAPLDAEVRTFLQPIVLEQANVHRVKHDESDVLAIGCGDVDSDGGNEIVVASRSRVVLAKLRGDVLTIVRSTPWAQLASRAPVPMRDPLASIVVPRDQRPEILLGSTERGAVATDAFLVTRRQLSGLPVPGGNGSVCALAAPELGGFDGGGVACTPPAKGDPASVLPLPTSRFDAVAMLDLVGRDGSLSQVVAARELSGKLRLRQRDASGRGTELPLDGVGAQVALADLDLDGIPEIALSGDLADGDVLSVWSWRPTGLVQRLRFPTRDPIRAIAICPPEERGLPALVAVVGPEIWLVR